MLPMITLGTLKFPTYFLVISLIFSAGIFAFLRRAEERHLDRNTCLDLCLTIMLSGILGARLIFFIFEAPEYLLANPVALLRVWEGGFVFYGGALSSAAAGIVFLKYRKEPLEPWLDAIAPVAAFGYGFGRIGCFLAGCCYGRACDLPWAVTFPEGVDAPPGVPIHPTQLYAVFWEIGVGGLLLLLERIRTVKFNPGSLFFVWMIFHALGRLVMEAFRADPRGPTLLGLTISGWTSIALLVAGRVLYSRNQRELE